MGATGEPLYLDVVSVINEAGLDVEVIGGRYGLSSKDTQPKDVKAVFDFLKGETWQGFTVGINDDVTHLSIPVDQNFHVENEYTSLELGTEFVLLGTSLETLGNHIGGQKVLALVVPIT
jgi:pyruvate-ferredoxin/flavodoxin oxidoreductase